MSRRYLGQGQIAGQPFLFPSIHLGKMMMLRPSLPPLARQFHSGLTSHSSLISSSQYQSRPRILSCGTLHCHRSISKLSIQNNSPKLHAKFTTTTSSSSSSSEVAQSTDSNSNSNSISTSDSNSNPSALTPEEIFSSIATTPQNEEIATEKKVEVRNLLNEEANEEGPLLTKAQKAELLTAVQVYKALTKDKLIVFLNGTVEQPKCARSYAIVKALQDEGARFVAFDVEAHPVVVDILKSINPLMDLPVVYLEERWMDCWEVLEGYRSQELDRKLRWARVKETTNPEYVLNIVGKN